MPPPPHAPPEPTPQQAAPKAAPGPGPVTSGQVASAPAATVALPAGTPKQQYEFAFDFLKKQDYPRAESALRQFLQGHPKDPLAGNAQYWLGETYYVRGDFQQAAVEFMAGYKNYPKTNKGPDNLLKLGMSMSKLNQKDGACLALGRIGKDYPDAPDTVLKPAQAERTRLKCKA
ncbi:MAG: tol-pal system protein YbgF [Rhodospirillaceae bacterium]|nr:tol-pal system protein YbgF [Rhodospirillaceae bacterium]